MINPMTSKNETKYEIINLVVNYKKVTCLKVNTYKTGIRVKILFEVDKFDKFEMTKKVSIKRIINHQLKLCV